MIAFHVPSNTIRTARRTYRGGTQRAQQGVALAVALVLLVLITLVGLAGVRGTMMQQKMAANQYDRQLAFQAAETALRVAIAKLATDPGSVARNCQAGGVVCVGNPFNDLSVASKIQLVSSDDYDQGDVSISQPQYLIENMGNWPNPSSNTGFGQSANAHNYGAQGASGTAIYYRITSRSSDPSVSGASERATVTLQIMVKQG
jgi:type IV pilus assembly protein PilX